MAKGYLKNTKIIIYLILFLLQITSYSSTTNNSRITIFSLNLNRKRFRYNDFLKSFYSQNFQKTILLYEQNPNQYKYSDLIAARAFLKIKNYYKATMALKKSLLKQPFIKDFVNYLLGYAYLKLGQLNNAYYHFYKVHRSSTYYTKAIKYIFRILYKRKNYSSILTFKTKSIYTFALFYKASSALKLNNRSKFNHYLKQLAKSKNYKYRKKAIILWIKAGKPKLNSETIFYLAKNAYHLRKYKFALKLLSSQQNLNFKMLDLKASIYLKLFAASTAQKLYNKIRKSNHRLKYKAEYMFYRCSSFLRKINHFSSGMRKIIYLQNHPYRIMALKTLFREKLKRKTIDLRILRLLSKTNLNFTKYFLNLINHVKYNKRKIVLMLANEILKNTKNVNLKAFLLNFIAEQYLNLGKTPLAVRYYKKSVLTSSNLYSCLSLVKLKEMNIDISNFVKTIKQNHIYSLNIINQKKRKLINQIANSSPFYSRKANIFLQMGDKHNTRKIIETYLTKHGQIKLLSVIKFLLRKNFLFLASEYSNRLQAFLNKNGFNNLFYYDLYRLMFPKAYDFLFYNVKNPLLLKSMVFAESYFHVYAYSKTGAIGLTQKMLKTARWLSKNYSLQKHQIFGYKLNIYLGDKFISWLLKKSSNKIVVLAGYNSGPTRFKRIAKKIKRFSISRSHFIKLIPFRETRYYIKTVLKAYAFLLIYGKGQ